jgi:hypothetical protein
VSHILNVKVANEKDRGVVKRLLKGLYSVPRTRPKTVIDVIHKIMIFKSMRIQFSNHISSCFTILETPIEQHPWLELYELITILIS